jgi:hypothetical protein
MTGILSLASDRSSGTSRVRVDRADPSVIVHASLWAAMLEGRLHPDVTYDNDLLTIDAINGVWIYRLAGLAGVTSPAGRGVAAGSVVIELVSAAPYAPSREELDQATDLTGAVARSERTLKDPGRPGGMETGRLERLGSLGPGYACRLCATALLVTTGGVLVCEECDAIEAGSRS